MAAREDISNMDGKAAIPRKSGEMVFHDEWERRAFAMAVALCENGHYEWSAFQAALIKEIDAANESPEHPDPSAPGYYEHWLASLERVISDKGILTRDSGSE